MTALTLLTRVHGSIQLRQVDEALKLLFEGLDVDAKVLGVAVDRWVQVSVAGEDEAIAVNYLAKEVGFCPVGFEGVKRFSTLSGYVTSFVKSVEELSVDVGVFQPKIICATVPLRHLQAQLVDGRKTGMRKMAELFGFCEGFPLSVKVVHVNRERDLIEAELSKRQVERFDNWRGSLLDRLIVLGSSASEVNKALERAELERDVIDVESLGMFEHALVCKLGTDAAGLISKTGSILRTARFAVFNPRRISGFLKSKQDSVSANQ